MILGCWTFSSITDEQISSIKTWYYPTIYFNWSIHYWTVGTGFVDVSPNAILWYNYQLMTKSKHDMNFTIFGVNSPQFSMDLPTANIINTPHPPTLHFSVNYTFHNCWVNNEPKNGVKNNSFTNKFGFDWIENLLILIHEVSTWLKLVSLITMNVGGCIKLPS